MSAGGVRLSAGVVSAWGCTPPPVNRITDRCKNHYLSATSFADGNKENVHLINKIKTTTQRSKEITQIKDDKFGFRLQLQEIHVTVVAATAPLVPQARS